MRRGLWIALGMLLAGAAAAQPPAKPPAPKPIEAVERANAVRAAAAALRERYIYPETAEKAAAAIEAKLAAGAYDAIDDRRAFAARLTEDLAAVAHDKHLRITSRSAPPPPPMGVKPPRSDGGFVRADRLPGNVGYIEVMAFPPLEVFGPAADKAMTAVADTRALIIDLRRNGGGNPASVSYLAGFLLPPGTHINDLIWRNPGTATFRTETFTTAARSPAFRRPVILLTSGRTFSGGEEFAYDLQTQKRATLIGEVTGGGANPGGGRPLGPDLGMFVPAGRAENPITKTSWEGKGVVPEVVTPAPDALAAALKRLGVTAKSGDVDAITEARLFTPRTTPRPGGEAALRARIPQLVTGAPDYAQMTSPLAETTRRQLPDLQKQLAAMGALKSVAFREVDLVGGDIYDVTFEKGAVLWTVVLAPDGKMMVSFFAPA